MTRHLRFRAAALLPLGGLAFLSGHADAAERGMPQLNIPDFAPQIVWLVFWFVILYVLMTTLALPKVKAAIEGRRDHISGDLGRAAALKEEAEATLAAYQKTLADARDRKSVV